MQMELVDRSQAWRNRGRPPRPIPEEVAQAAEMTYRTGKCYVVAIDADEEEEIRELESLLTAYAGRKGKRMRFQREDDVLRFEMVDIKRRALRGKKAS